METTFPVRDFTDISQLWNLLVRSYLKPHYTCNSAYQYRSLLVGAGIHQQAKLLEKG